MGTIQIESKLLKAAKTFEAKTDVRYYLCGIHLNKRGAIEVSDGHTGFVSEQEELKTLKDSMIIKIHGNIPAKSGMAYIEIIDDKKGIITFESNESLLAFSIIDGKFPDMERVIPKDCDAAAVQAIGVNADYVLRLQKASKILGNIGNGMNMEFYGKNSAIKITIGNYDCECMVLIMPMRL